MCNKILPQMEQTESLIKFLFIIENHLSENVFRITLLKKKLQIVEVLN